MINFLFTAKKADSSTDTTEWEKQIDQKVYELYGLTPDEIAIVEGRQKKFFLFCDRINSDGGVQYGRSIDENV